MYNIGYIDLTEAYNQNWSEWFDESNYSVNQLTSVAFNDFKDQNILLIEDQEISDISVICKLLIEAKKYPEILVYIISPLQNLEKSIKDVYFQLGVNGIKDESIDWEEFSFVIKNTVGKIVKVSATFSEVIPHGKYNNTQLEPVNLSILIDNDEIPLTKLEYKIVEQLHTSIGKTVSYEELSEKIWADYSEEKKYRVSNMVFNIRKKIEQTNHNSKCIKTVRSKGYMWTS